MKKLLDRKSTRLNSSHDQISYAVFCLKKKKKKKVGTDSEPNVNSAQSVLCGAQENRPSVHHRIAVRGVTGDTCTIKSGVAQRQNEYSIARVGTSTRIRLARAPPLVVLLDVRRLRDDLRSRYERQSGVEEHVLFLFVITPLLPTSIFFFLNDPPPPEISPLPLPAALPIPPTASRSPASTSFCGPPPSARTMTSTASPG